AVTSAIALASAGQSTAADRVALVIGNDAYQSLLKLANPGADAGELARLFAANGFEVLSCDGKRPGCFEVTREGLLDALETLRNKAKGKDLAIVFFSGHGMQGPDGNVLAPVDMNVDCAENTMRRGVLLNDLLNAVAGARQKIVMIDACRNNPLPQCPLARGFMATNFCALSVPDAESFLLVPSTKPGQVALDGFRGEHSSFAALPPRSVAIPPPHNHSLTCSTSQYLRLLSFISWRVGVARIGLMSSTGPAAPRAGSYAPSRSRGSRPRRPIGRCLSSSSRRSRAGPGPCRHPWT